jgi:nucleotide-binding universal stress UspA family protein
MYENILLAVDREDEPGWRLALDAALAQRQAFGGRLHVLTVVHPIGVGDVADFLPMDFEQRMLDGAAAWLRDVLARHLPAETEPRLIVGHGKVYAEILRVAREVRADLIVLSAHRPEFPEYLLGTNAARVLRHSECSVLVVRKASAA